MKISDKLFNTTCKRNIPLSVIFELTQRCNLNCLHCYIPTKVKSDEELSTREVKRILNELAKAGTLYLVFTGGEIFLRNDVFDILEYSKRLNFDVRVFTNGTLIDGATARRLSVLGISAVELSLYGKRATHDFITRSSGSFDKTVAAIKLLKKHKVKVVIKTPIMRLNFNNILWIKTFARKNGLVYRFDPTISPKNDGGKSILKYRINRKQMKKLFADEKKLFRWTRTDSGEKPSAGHLPSDLLSCSAGRNFAAVAYDGTVYPCLLLMMPVGNLKETGFKKIWNSVSVRKNVVTYVKNKDYSPLGLLRSLTPEALPVCSKCDLVAACQRCPGLALLEDGDLLGPSRIACQIAMINYQSSKAM